MASWVCRNSVKNENTEIFLVKLCCWNQVFTNLTFQASFSLKEMEKLLNEENNERLDYFTSLFCFLELLFP